MKRIALLGLLACLAAWALPEAQGQAQAQQASASAQSEPLVKSRSRKARPQIRVRPRCVYRTYHTIYPPPNDCEWPGPNAKRNCSVRYVQEFRPSGTVIVPRMNCWWVPG